MKWQETCILFSWDSTIFMEFRKVPMTTERIVTKISPLPGEAAQPVEEVKISKENQVDLVALKESLQTKRQLLSLLEKCGLQKPDPDLYSNVDRAIADLDEIIRAFPAGV